jgi:hypothetical protein
MTPGCPWFEWFEDCGQAKSRVPWFVRLGLTMSGRAVGPKRTLLGFGLPPGGQNLENSFELNCISL